MISKKTKIQLAIFVVIAVVFGAVMIFGYMNLPAKLFGLGQYTVTLRLPKAGGLYPTANVTYRGTEVGRVQSIGLDDNGGVSAVLSLKSGRDIPSDLRAEVHSQSAIGEQYVELLPRNGSARPLAQGDVISAENTFIPPDINSLLDAANTGLRAIPGDNLKTAIDESYAAVGGLGPDISRLVKGSTALAAAARANLDPLTTLIDQWSPLADSQIRTTDSIQAWAANMAAVTTSLQRHNADTAGLIEHGVSAAQQARLFLERLQPTLPVLLANLVSINQVAVTYQPNIEQLLVLLPQGIAQLQGPNLANRDNKDKVHKGIYLAFNLNINLPPPCTTGFLPAQQRRSPSFQDYPERPAGDMYCRTPQDSAFNVRGARNIPCETVPGKRAPTVKLCESQENYIPLNDGYNWKGDPNATDSGQAIPDLGPGHSPPAGGPAPPPQGTSIPMAVAQYDPSTGSYLGPDGQVYTQADLADNRPKEQTWQSMLTPPAN
ncbi:MlaD family protein [Mycobacteroides abscessus]|uniref:MCE family protein n=1 Tax=Mycobacteroides abscessus TaxID=36809 RepID=UPI00078C37E9|nr:MlaD family protein [Mycobacteroides abscessus]AMU69566.1 mammalian cell entry protein [Mycobacteroides abscessus]MDM2014602.1 MlaD family protein [Mycobacteroides abscessus]MDM2020243.1 MlaD family protein [Mycobacteroides abscessus]MDM2023889.1 MlaD family protein [Mycobacteroides abscessus]MDM2028840.1 MlaD family protein [Mycobacteroides abscessus]